MLIIEAMFFFLDLQLSLGLSLLFGCQFCSKLGRVNTSWYPLTIFIKRSKKLLVVRRLLIIYSPSYATYGGIWHSLTVLMCNCQVCSYSNVMFPEVQRLNILCTLFFFFSLFEGKDWNFVLGICWLAIDSSDIRIITIREIKQLTTYLTLGRTSKLIPPPLYKGRVVGSPFLGFRWVKILWKGVTSNR